ncbi:MAG: Holliday junction branch migration protein RuvA, partial [Sphingomonadales bacterium]
MIAKLKGLVDSIGENTAVIDVGGVGYQIFASAKTLRTFPGVGEPVEVLIETHVREDHIHLYGFVSGVELDMFRLLTSVQGVGTKVALAILSTLDPNALQAALISGDKAAITSAPGVGPKLAARILNE